jgi:hypothetical protein
MKKKKRNQSHFPCHAAEKKIKDIHAPSI